MTPKKNGSAGTTFKLDSLTTIADREEEGTWVDIQHPSGGPLYLGGQRSTPLRIRIAGTYSQRYRQAMKAVRERAMRPSRRLTLDDVETREMDLLSTLTLEWEGAFDDEGTEIPFNKENAQVLYRAAPFIAEQVDAATVDHARFFESV